MPPAYAVPPAPRASQRVTRSRERTRTPEGREHRSKRKAHSSDAKRSDSRRADEPRPSSERKERQHGSRPNPERPKSKERKSERFLVDNPHVSSRRLERSRLQYNEFVAERERKMTYQPPAIETRNKDWSCSSESTEYSTSSEERGPPPDKVYLPKCGFDTSGDVESHLTLDTGVADHNKRSSPRSTRYKRLDDADLKSPSPKHRARLNRWYEKRASPAVVKTLTMNLSTSDDEIHTLQTFSSDEGALLGAADLPNITKGDRAAKRTKQSIAFMAILVTVAQLFVLMFQSALCGIANWDINPMIGPYPDAFSEWGGKNPYLMLHDNQWWRLITPSFLHVGFLHFLANAFCQLEAIALFEREWGSFRWLLIYIISSVGCNAVSSFFDSDTIAVGSSGALMGLYAAKLAQVCGAVFFDVTVPGLDDSIRLDQLSSVLCGLTIVSLLSSFTYIDWSGHMGGLFTGFLAGMVLFSYNIRRCCTWFLWSVAGLLGLVALLFSVIYFFITTVQPYDELADPCEYFRGLFPEGYDCGCMW